MHVQLDHIVDGMLPAWHPHTGSKPAAGVCCWRFRMELLGNVLQTSTNADQGFGAADCDDGTNKTTDSV